MRLPLLALVVLLSGCFRQIAIRPDQLPVLSSMSSPTPIARSGDVTVVAVPTATVVTPEGMNVEIRSPYNAIIETLNDAPLEFEHPVTSSLTATTLTVAGGNRPATDFRLSTLQGVSVTQIDGPATVLLSVGLSVGISLLVTGLVFASMPHY